MVAFSAVIFGTGLRAEDAIVLPSGMLVTPLDTIHGAPGPDGLTIRFRFVAPDLADRPADETTLSDMTWLCESYALPRIATPGPVPEQIVITLADRPVEFGTVTPEAKQYFEAFRPERILDILCNGGLVLHDEHAHQSSPLDTRGATGPASMSTVCRRPSGAIT